MNWKRGFKRIIHVLAVVGAIAGGVSAGLEAYNEYDDARTRTVGRIERILFESIAEEQYKKSVEEDPLDENESKNQRINRLIEEKFEHEQKKRFWYNLSRAELIGMIVLFGLGGAVVGWIGTWVILWYGGLIVFMFLRWLALGFREDKQKQ